MFLNEMLRLVLVEKFFFMELKLTLLLIRNRNNRIKLNAEILKNNVDDCNFVDSTTDF